MNQKQQHDENFDFETDPDLVTYIEIIEENFSGLPVKEGIQLAQRLKERGYLEMAKIYLELTLMSAPDFTPARVELANLLFQTGYEDDAEKLYEILVKDNDTSEQSQLMYNLGLIYWRKGKKEEAAKLWKQIVAEDPGFLASYDALIYYAKEKGNKQQVRSLLKRREKGPEIVRKQYQNRLQKELTKQYNNRSWLEKLLSKIFGI